MSSECVEDSPVASNEQMHLTMLICGIRQIWTDLRACIQAGLAAKGLTDLIMIYVTRVFGFGLEG